MLNTEKRDGQRLRRARTATLLISLIAVTAIVLAFYAFEQKKKAEEQTNLATQKAIEAMQQRQMEIEQRNIADSNREKAIQQTELAQENERTAIQQKQIADTQTRKAKENELLALQQKVIADEQKSIAESQKEIAQKNLEEATKQKAYAEEQKNIAKDEKQISGKLKELADCRSMANESVLLLNENLFDSSKRMALQAYQLNANNNGPVQNNDIYNALYFNWAKNINYKNQAAIHLHPVHCVTGLNNNTIFTADEGGMLCESVIKNNGLQKVASYPVKEEVRALSISPDGNKLVAITATGNGIVFSVSSSNISPQKTFKFQGVGKDVAFDDNNDLVVLSNKGFSKFELSRIQEDDFFDEGGVNAFLLGRNGKMYVASGNEIDVYENWDDLLHNSKTTLKKFDSKVTSIAIDNNEKILAAGTYNGFVSLTDLENNNEIWSRALHSSGVNALRFNTVGNNILQLASAGSDQVIRLIDINAILQKNFNEDILTLKGHTKWIYDLYYTPDGHWLFSSSEDNKVIAWKTTMKDLYLTLNTQ
jgi:WD40 repeat protein